MGSVRGERECRREVDEALSRTEEELRQLDQDVEVVAVVSAGKTRLNLDNTNITNTNTTTNTTNTTTNTTNTTTTTTNTTTTNTTTTTTTTGQDQSLLTSDFSHTCLVHDDTLRTLEKATTSQKCGESEVQEDEAEKEVKDEEVEALRTLRGQLLLEVEAARQDLHQINNFKVGRDVLRAAAGAANGGAGGQKDPSHLYASLQRLQQLQGKRAEGVMSACGRVEREVRRGRVRVRDLQNTADSLAREIEVLQAQVAHARPEVVVASREARLRRVMTCTDLTSQSKTRQATIQVLQTELDALRLRTFPTLSRPSPTQ
ncbi:hypothetical protein Pcinc_043881 [Petrolisthes cinctipes]|uniref:Uncharacterized protein n=1 Tax=Petrolisthes cinctipes TaxID=88211 RepID=A0AAE1BF68_PETCI|nr:hypothetical protein Pcinc_043881 [Petrolisthes cinctipes]